MGVYQWEWVFTVAIELSLNYLLMLCLRLVFMLYMFTCFNIILPLFQLPKKVGCHFGILSYANNDSSLGVVGSVLDFDIIP